MTAGAQARQAPATLSHELLWSFQRVGAPVPSPDGKWVVFSVSEPSYDPQKDVTDLWVVPGDGSAAPRRLTSSKGSESGPAWSPDSARIAFAAKRDDDEVNQIYVLDVVRGGEAQRVTAAATVGERAALESGRPEDPLSSGDVAGRDRRGDEPQSGAGTKEHEIEGADLRLVSD